MIDAIVYAAASQAMRIFIIIVAAAIIVGLAVGTYLGANVSDQIYKITYKTAAGEHTRRVQAKSPDEAERHVFRPHTTRLTAVQDRELERAGFVLEIAGEVDPLPLSQQP
jgi:hypothetical protein